MNKTPYTVEHCAIVVLAAGMSSRLGSPKQLLTYHGKSLIQHAINIALQTTMRPVIAVVGSNSIAARKEIENMNVEIIENKEWEEGIASSIRCGLGHVQKMNNNVDGIIFMVCDQPFISTKLLDTLLTEQNKTGLPIVASSYGNTIGVPALFHKIFFKELMELKGDTGARKLIRQHEGRVTSVAFAEGIIDIDTKKDYEGLIQ